MKKFVAPLALSALAASALTFAVASNADAAATTVQVRQADLITALSDTRATGHLEFLKEGVHAYTEGATSTDKVAEYFAMTGEIPASGSYAWYGTDNQPGAQIVFDKDQTTGNGNDFNVLVGEQVYSDNAPGEALTDWWYTGGSAKALTNGITCPSTSGGSGSDCHGTLAEWATALTTERVYAGGFSLGSGVKGDGVLRSVTYGETTYAFTSEAAPTASPTPTATPTPTTVAVTGVVQVKAKKSKIVVQLASNLLPANSVEGTKLTYTVRVDRKRVATLNQGASDYDKLVYRFAKKSGKHKVEVFNGTKRVAKGVIRN